MMYATDRQMSDAQHRLMPPPYGAGNNNSTWLLYLDVKDPLTSDYFKHVFSVRMYTVVCNKRTKHLRDET